MPHFIGCSSGTMASRLARRAEAFWYGKSSVAALLQPLAWLFRMLVAVRRWAYRSGILPQHRLPVPVVVVGNLTVGGTGKTPVVAWLAKQLHAAGYAPGIVSRGYGGRYSVACMCVRDDSDPAEVGDEPVLLARRTGCKVVVGRDRVAAARMLVTLGADVILSDDGLQHYRLGRDVEIAVVDGDRGFGNGQFLPAGPLREPIDRLAEVDLLLINGPGQMAGINGQRFHLVNQGAISLDGQRHRSLESFSGDRVWAVAGIGNPKRFITQLRDAGMVVEPVEVPDHGRVSIQGLLDNVPMSVLMTEKDAIKYSDMRSDDVWYVPVQLEFEADVGTDLVQQIVAGFGYSESNEASTKSPQRVHQPGLGAGKGS
jgi:tetraacyldisaccharide 4'-kinase